MLNNLNVNQFNAIKLYFNTEIKRVTDVQLVLKQSYSNTIYLIENFNKEEKDMPIILKHHLCFQKILTALPEMSYTEMPTTFL
jgi:hypothetical protein